MATSWSPSPDDTKMSVTELADSLEDLDAEMDDRVIALIESLGLSEQFATTSDFLSAVSEIELIRSDLAQTDSDMTLTFNRLKKTEDGLDQLFSSFTFGEDGGTPYLEMRLTNTQLAFVMGGDELAYFSDNKLYVTKLEAVDQISIGTSANGYLDIVTTPTGVGFKWRS